MKIIEFKATTGYTGLLISVRGTYPEENAQKAYKLLSEKAFAIYEKKVKADPQRLAKYEMRFCIWESEPGQDGLFHCVRTIYRDYAFERGDVRNNIVLINEQTFNK